MHTGALVQQDDRPLPTWTLCSPAQTGPRCVSGSTYRNPWSPPEQCTRSRYVRWLVFLDSAVSASHGALKRNDPRGEIRCGGSPCSGPRYAVTLRRCNVRPPFALSSCRRRQCASEERLNLIEREHDDGGVAVFQVGVERTILARNRRDSLLDGKDARCTRCNRRRPGPPGPDAFDHRRPINHSHVNRRPKPLGPSLVDGTVNSTPAHPTTSTLASHRLRTHAITIANLAARRLGGHRQVRRHVRDDS